MSGGTTNLRNSGLSDQEERPHWDNWYNGLELGTHYQSFLTQLRPLRFPEGHKEQMRETWIRNIIHDNKHLIALMGEAYRALNLKVYYEERDDG